MKLSRRIFEVYHFGTGGLMKIKKKALISASLTGILFLGSAVLLTPAHFGLILCLSAVSYIAIFILFQQLIVGRIEKLNQVIERENIKPTLPESSLSIRSGVNDDEISFITSAFIDSSNNIQLTQDYLEMKYKNEIRLLKEENIHLKQSLSARHRTDQILRSEKSAANVTHTNKTELPSGTFFNEILSKAINYSNRRKQILAIMLIDIDGLNALMESVGEANTQLIINEVSDRLTKTLRKEDILAKVDGNEFIVLLNDINKPKFASAVAQKLLAVCSQTIKIAQQEFSLSISVGISIFPNDGKTLETLIENANKALFKAQQAGGNAYQFHINELHVEALEYLQLESALRKAIQNNELSLCYQPKYRIKTGNIAGVEALMRWEHPVLGIINPVKFIELAEESGLIIQIGEWALTEAAQRIKYWQNEGYEHISLALKLSKKQFYHPDISKVFEKVVTDIGIDPQFIDLEISEQAVMEDIQSATTILTNLKNLGAKISLDHFGTGYTSISHLKNLPISAIKIDKSYIKGIPNSPDDLAIVSAIIALAHTLGLEVIAEGVENAEQIQYLSGQHCDIVQGYFLSHPITAQNIALQFRKLQDEVLA